MKSFTEYLTFDIPERMAFLNITPDLERIVMGSGVGEGRPPRGPAPMARGPYWM